MRKWHVLATLLLVSGCVPTTEIQWARLDYAKKSADQSLAECRHEFNTTALAGKLDSIDRMVEADSFLIDCMAARGWQGYEVPVNLASPSRTTEQRRRGS
jgi:hypothetical protein